MGRSKLKSRFNKKGTAGGWDNYKNQRNFCVSLLNVKNLIDSKIFENLVKIRTTFQTLYSSSKRTSEFGVETIAYRGPHIWTLLPNCNETATFFKIHCVKSVSIRSYLSVVSPKAGKYGPE